MKIKSLAMLSLFIGISGCATTESNKSPQYGIPPYDPEAQVLRFLKESLKDPDSIKAFAITSPVKCSQWTGLLYKGNVHGWCAMFEYNAKNSYGAYVGLKRHRVLFKDGEPVWTK